MAAAMISGLQCPALTTDDAAEAVEVAPALGVEQVGALAAHQHRRPLVEVVDAGHQEVTLQR